MHPQEHAQSLMWKAHPQNCFWNRGKWGSYGFWFCSTQHWKTTDDFTSDFKRVGAPSAKSLLTIWCDYILCMITWVEFYFFDSCSSPKCLFFLACPINWHILSHQKKDCQTSLNAPAQLADTLALSLTKSQEVTFCFYWPATPTSVTCWLFFRQATSAIFNIVLQLWRTPEKHPLRDVTSLLQTPSSCSPAKHCQSWGGCCPTTCCTDQHCTTGVPCSGYCLAKRYKDFGIGDSLVSQCVTHKGIQIHG